MSTVIQSSSVFDQVRAAFPFSVDKHRLYGPENIRTGHFGLFRSDTGECVGAACRESYRPHTVEDVAAMAQVGAGVFDGDCRVRCHWRRGGGHVVSIVPSDDYRRAIFGTKDNVFPRLFIDAGYDGTPYRGSLGYYRDACRNLAMMRSAGAGISRALKHTRNIGAKLDDLRTEFLEIAAGWDGTVNTMRAMESRQVNLAEFLQAVYPVSEDSTGRARKSQEKRISAIFSRIYSERLATGRPALRDNGAGKWIVSAWEAFNGVQGYVQHQQTRHGRPGEFDRALLAMGDSAVLRAEQLAVAV